MDYLLLKRTNRTDLRKPISMNKMSSKGCSRSHSPKYQNKQSKQNNMFTHLQECELYTLYEVITILSCLAPKNYFNITEFEYPNFPSTLPSTPAKDLLAVAAAWNEKTEKIADLLYSSGLKAKRNSAINAHMNCLLTVIPFTDKLNSVIGNENSSSLLSPISTYLNCAVQYFYKYVPHCCLAYILGNRLQTMYEVRKLLKLHLEEKKLFNEMKNMIIEAEYLDEDNEEILFSDKNEAIVNQVEALYSGYRSSMYTFGMLFLAVVVIAPTLLQNPAFLYRLLAFNNSETAGRYYQRFFKDQDPYSFTTPSNSMGDNSLGLSLLLEATVNVRESPIKTMAMELIPTTIPQYALGATTLLDFHYAYREFNTVVKDKKYSLFETLFTSTQSRLREVNNFMRRYRAEI